MPREEQRSFLEIPFQTIFKLKYLRKIAKRTKKENEEKHRKGTEFRVTVHFHCKKLVLSLLLTLLAIYIASQKGVSSSHEASAFNVAKC